MPRRFQPLSRMILTLAAALAVGVVLEAEGLKIWAERLEIGFMRNVSVPVTESWHRLAGSFGAEAPRRAALDAKAQWADRFAPPTGQEVAGADAGTEPAHDEKRLVSGSILSAPPASSSAPATASPVKAQGREAPRVAQAVQSAPVAALPVEPSVERPPVAVGGAPHVVLAGDSMMAVGLAPVLRRGLGVNVVKAYRSGTGLARPEVFDWLVQYPVMVSGVKPALVICALGANDGQNVQVGKKVLAFGSPEWDAFYRGRLTAYLDLLTRDGHKVLWVGMPLMRSQPFSRKMKHMNALVQDVLKDYPQVSWLDPNPALGYGSAVFAQYGADARGRMIKLRQDDGIHMTDEGAAFLLPAIRQWMSSSMGERAAAASKPGA